MTRSNITVYVLPVAVARVLMMAVIGALVYGTTAL